MRLRAIAVALVAALAVAGAGESAAGKTHKTAKVRLKAFSDCNALIEYGKKHVKKEQRSSAGPSFGEPAPPAVGEDTDPRAQPAAGEGQDNGDSSSTNVQEAEIDEPDIVKSKGSRIFAVAGGALRSIGTGQGDPRLLDTLTLEGWGHQLLVQGDRLLVIGYEYGFEGSKPDDGVVSSDMPYFSEPKTILTEVDVSDAKDLTVVRTQSVDGTYVSARLTGETARVVISSTPRAIAEPALRERASGWRPAGVLAKTGSDKRTKKPLSPCRKIRRPKVFSGLDTLTVLTIGMDKGLPAVDSDAILTDGHLVYGSRKNLYVATQRWVEAPESGEEPPGLSTALHKFDASEPGVTSYSASGKVRGTLLSQWSLSDHNGALRVASTDSPLWWDGPPRDESESFVTTFEEHAGALVQVGQVGGLGLGERIYAVRFMGDAGYVVTFRQVDPLYTLDLADPKKPRVAGELKVRGYSAYLHPVGQDLLLGVGQDATDEGAALGTQLSLFDVSDAAKPVRLHKHAIGSGSSTDVEYEHHAFLWWGPAKLAVLPLQVWDDGGGPGFVGAAGYQVEQDSGIDEAGRASHDNGDYEDRILRSLVVNGRLFTLSDSGLEMNSLETLSGLAWVPFPAP